MPTPKKAERKVRKSYLLPPPEAVEPSVTVAVDPEPAVPAFEPIPRDASIAFNAVTSLAMAEIRAECVDPWLESDGPEEAEFALNALVVDGAIADIELLTVVDDLPAHVVDCIGEVAWDQDWPEFDMTGTVRYQRAVHAKRRSHGLDDL